jgi:hypothetical protein
MVLEKDGQDKLDESEKYYVESMRKGISYIK